MPVSFLSTTQRERYGRYPETLSSEELARYFHLDDDDREWIATKRRDSHRLGYALQLTTARFLGTFLEDPAAVPGAVLHTLSSQLGIADPDCVLAYRESEQRWRHTTEIRARYGAEEDVQAAFPESRLALLRHGLKLDDQPLRPAQVEWINPQQLRFVLREGKKRQIRRMCELVGLRVTGLKRVRIGGLRLGALPLGQWRYLREDEGF